MFSKLFIPAEGALLDSDIITGKLIEGNLTVETFYKVPSDTKRIDIIDLITFKKGNTVIIISFFTIVAFLLLLLARLFC